MLLDVMYCRVKVNAVTGGARIEHVPEDKDKVEGVIDIRPFQDVPDKCPQSLLLPLPP